METISPSIEATLEFLSLPFASRYTNTLTLLPAEQWSYFNNPFIASNSGGGAIYSFFWLEGGPKPWGMASGTKGAAGLAQQRACH